MGVEVIDAARLTDLWGQPVVVDNRTNVAASEASEVVRPYLPLAERIGRLFSGLAGGAPETLEVFYEGEIADYDCRVLTLAIRSLRSVAPGSLAARFRQRRFVHLRSLLATVPKPFTILDVGGTESFWETVGMFDESAIEIVLLNLSASPVRHPQIRSVAGTAIDMSEFAENQFDVVFSNSVIEPARSGLTASTLPEPPPIISHASSPHMSSTTRNPPRNRYSRRREVSASLKPHPALIRYEINASAWHDGATAERFIALPGSERMEFTEERGWNFPNGTAIVQTLNRDGKRIETRVLLRQQMRPILIFTMH